MIDKVIKETEAKSSKLVTDAQQEADNIILKAQQTAKELVAKAENEASDKWVSIVNQATEIANRTLELAGVEKPEEQKAKPKPKKHSDTKK